MQLNINVWNTKNRIKMVRYFAYCLLSVLTNEKDKTGWVDIGYGTGKGGGNSRKNYNLIGPVIGLSGFLSTFVYIQHISI